MLAERVAGEDHIGVGRFSRISFGAATQQLGILTSDSTLLRQFRRKVIVSPARAPRVLGIDDWAWRKGHRYSTILCDLERGKVVDLFPDRSTESTAQWNRDCQPGSSQSLRPSGYGGRTARCARCRPLASSSHLSEALVGALVPHHRLLVEAARASASQPLAPATLAVPPSVVTRQTSRNQEKQQRNRERRLAADQIVMEQISKGITQHGVAQNCGLGIRTIRRRIRARGFPERKLGNRKTTVDEYREYPEQRWNEGCLWHELRARGFAGQAPLARTWVRRRYGEASTAPNSNPPSTPRRVYPHDRQPGRY
jgi:hypothetical protein